jgi:hypothetical protein
MNQTPYYLNNAWRYQDSATHASAEAFRRRQEQRQRDAERGRREAEERAANEEEA